VGLAPLDLHNFALTPDVEGANDGQIHHHRFACRDFIRPFLESLKEEPRSLRRISSLGTLTPQHTFQVSVFAPERRIGSGAARREYWLDFDASTFSNSVVFFDPDNGFETKKNYTRGKLPVPEWIGHDELKNVFARLPDSSVAVVYQHRPHRNWTDLFKDLAQNLSYLPVTGAALESGLAFVALAGDATAGKKITMAMTEYAKEHPSVDFTGFPPAGPDAPV